ncbi:MAG: RecX family transcriptional regulator [Bacteroidetes bacterium]|jgi:regulatory protein|nr:RecX family transcriptional regulator [Bacteroidota bacterium]
MSVRIRQDQLPEFAEKARRFCAYQERCRFDLESKLYGWGLSTKQVGSVCKLLEEEGFINQERFVQAYVKGKFNQLGWGKIKIANALRTKNVEPAIIEKGLNGLNMLEYESRILQLLQRKQSTLARLPLNEQRRRMYAFALQKGYETDLVSRLLTDLGAIV